MIILIIMITIIQQITIKNQFLLRVSKINIFWLDCTQNSIFPFTWFPSQKEKQEKESSEWIFPKLKNYLISLFFWVVIYVVLGEMKIYILFFMSCISSIDLPSVIQYCGSIFPTLHSFKMKVNLFIHGKS